jgi:hypothetical protein
LFEDHKNLVSKIRGYQIKQMASQSDEVLGNMAKILEKKKHNYGGSDQVDKLASIAS